MTTSLKIIDTFLELLHSITERPPMYGVNNVEDIHFIIMGYQFALYDNPEKEKFNNFLSQFREFINKDFETGVDYDWVRLIRFHSGGDKHSIELFSSLLNKYLTSPHLADMQR
jgi:hypothetical protein